MQEVKYTECLQEAVEQLTVGAFLNVQSGDKVNTMTIAWGNIGFMWKRPIMTVMVRYSRHTYDLINNAQEFTVSLPLNGQLKEELAFCGSKSGRDYDKFTECNLTKVQGNKVNVPIIGECDLHFECKIVGKQAMTNETLLKDLDDAYYKNDNYHVLYYGEIVGAYKA